MRYINTLEKAKPSEIFICAKEKEAQRQETGSHMTI